MMLRTPLVLSRETLRRIAHWGRTGRTEVLAPTVASKTGPADSLHAPAGPAVALSLSKGLLLLSVGLLRVARAPLVRVALHRAELRRLPSPGRVSVLCAVACFVDQICGKES